MLKHLHNVVTKWGDQTAQTAIGHNLLVSEPSPLANI
jgi:hypothetical protein